MGHISRTNIIGRKYCYLRQNGTNSTNMTKKNEYFNTLKVTINYTKISFRKFHYFLHITGIKKLIFLIYLHKIIWIL